MQDNNLVALNGRGELIVTLTCGYDVQFKISSWQSGLNFFIYEDGKWLLDESDAGVLFSTKEKLNNIDAADLFSQSIPADIRKAVLPFHHCQFSLLRLVASYPEFKQLLLHSTMLCWLVVCMAHKAQWPLMKVAKLLRLKRVYAVEKVCGIRSKQWLNFINKLQVINGSEGELLLILSCLKNTNMIHSFKHWQAVPIQALFIVKCHPEFINSRLLVNELKSEKSTQRNMIHFATLSQTRDDISRLYQSLGRSFDTRIWLSFESELQLYQLHERVTQRYNNSEQGRLDALAREQEIPAFLRTEHPPIEDKPYPVSPLGDFENLVQIKDRKTLSEEGIYMNHCVGSYDRHLQSGNSYIYKLLSPERATLEVKIQHHKLRIVQFKLARNRKPSKTTYQYLIDLLQSSQSVSGASIQTRP